MKKGIFPKDFDLDCVETDLLALMLLRYLSLKILMVPPPRAIQLKQRARHQTGMAGGINLSGSSCLSHPPFASSEPSNARPALRCCSEALPL